MKLLRRVGTGMLTVAVGCTLLGGCASKILDKVDCTILAETEQMLCEATVERLRKKRAADAEETPATPEAEIPAPVEA